MRERTVGPAAGRHPVAPGAAVRRVAARLLLGARGLQAWICGEVREREPGDHSDGAPKGGQGGAAQLTGNYATR